MPSVRASLFGLGLCLCSLWFTGCRSGRALWRGEDMKSIVKAEAALGVRIAYDDPHAFFVEAASWLGTPYRNGGTERGGVDCSGLTRGVYAQVWHAELPRRAADQYASAGKKHKKNLRPGDLLFFQINKKGRRKQCDHVGLYLKDGRFIHASPSRGVVVERLSLPYWKERFLGAAASP